MTTLSNYQYFTIDHDRENNPDAKAVKSEVSEEFSFLKETILQKYVTNDLDPLQLSRLLNRCSELSYFLGRADAEKYNQKQEEIS